MEFKIAVDKLQDIISRLSNVIKINESDVTGMLCIEAGENNVTFKGTKNTIYIAINSEDCEITSKGKALCRFGDVKGYIMRFVPLGEDYGTENFHFIIGDSEGVIKTKTCFQGSKPSYRTLKFELFSIAQFPTIKPFGEAELIVNSNILKRGIDKVLHCIDPTEIRSALKGMNVTLDDGKIIFVGTNGVKLVENVIDINADIKHASYVLHYDLATILRLVLDDDSQVFMYFEGRHIYLKSNSVYIVGSLYVESYPNYKAMFDYNNVISFPRMDFTDSVVSVMDVLDPEDNSRLTLSLSGNKLLLKNDRVEVIHEFDENFESELDVDINGVFLASLLKDFTGDTLEIYFTPGNNYIVFKSKDDDKHTALLTVVLRR